MHFSCGRNKIVTSFFQLREEVSGSHTLGLPAAKQQIRPSLPRLSQNQGAKVFEGGSPAACTLRSFSRAAKKSFCNTCAQLCAPFG